jgi:hypothetical protein
MRKSIFTFIILCLCGILAAQFVVWRDGEIIFQTEMSKVDSITLYELDLPDNGDDNNGDNNDDDDNPPVVKKEFSVFYDGVKIENKGVVEVNMNHYESGDLIANFVLKNEANEESCFSAPVFGDADWLAAFQHGTGRRHNSRARGCAGRYLRPAHQHEERR